MTVLKKMKVYWAALAIFLIGLMAGLGIGRTATPVNTENYMPDDINPRYTVNISQTIEYGLIYSKTDMVTGETRMYIVKNGKLKPFLSDTSN